VQSAQLFTNTFETCVAPASYNTTELDALAQLLCASDTVPSSDQLDEACALNAESLSVCSASTVVGYLLEAQRDGVAGAACCNTLADDDGKWRLVCQRGGSMIALLTLPVLLVLAVLLHRLRRRQFLLVRCCKAASGAARRHISFPRAGSWGGSVRSSEGAGVNDSEIRQVALGRHLLNIASGSEEKRKIDEIVLRHTKAFGLQPDSAANQAEHLLSLVLSYTAQNGGDFDAAVDSLHAKILGPAERWRENVDPEWKPRGGGVSKILRRLPGIEWTLRRTRGGKIGLQRSTYVGLVTSGGRMAPWVQLGARQQLEEVALFLLLWGEAANLRFMPEMLYFLFECARAWEPEESQSVATQGQSRKAWAAEAMGDAAAELREMRATVTAARDAAARGHALPRDLRPAPFTFLERLVRPVFNCIKGEAKVHPDAPRNYDDWNEAFWHVDTLSQLRTMANANGSSGGGTSVLDAPPSERWPLLLAADWPRFFATVPKTHRELRWWFCLLSANRRVFLLHAILFGFVVIIRMPLENDGSWELGGWGALRILPFIFIFAPLASVGGRAFECWARPSVRARSDVVSAVLILLLTVGLCGFILSQQLATPYAKFEELPFTSPEVSAVLISSFVLAIVGAWRMVAEFMPRAAGRRADPDAQLHYEERTKALKHEPWLARRAVLASVTTADSGRSVRVPTPQSPRQAPVNVLRTPEGDSANVDDGGGGGSCGRPRLRTQAAAVLKLTGFWAAIFGAKLAFAGTLLVPTLLSAHGALVNTFPVSTLLSANEAAADAGSGASQEKTIAEVAFEAYAAISLRIDAALLLRTALTVALWACGATIFLADTLAFYQIGISLYGGIFGVATNYADADLRDRVLRSSRRWCATSIKKLQAGAYRTIFPALAASESEARRLVRDQSSTVFGGATASVRSIEGRSSRFAPAWRRMWAAVLEDLYAGCLLTADERTALLKGESTVTLHSAEAARRLNFFAHSLNDAKIRPSHGVLQAPMLTVMVPVYGEPITLQLPLKEGEEPPEPEKGRRAGKRLTPLEMDFLKGFFEAEWKEFSARIASSADGAARRSMAEAAKRELATRRWASERWQSVSRTLDGMLKYHTAISLLLRDEMPGESEATRAAVARLKFRCVAAMQVYAKFDSGQLADVERLVERYEGALCVAYIEDVEVAQGSQPKAAQKTFYSCLIDGTLTDGAGKLRKDAEGRLAPTYQIELPGMPILGNGKSDNQNCALPFTRGPILQAIDCNQEGYLEEAFKIPCALREFEEARGAGAADKPKPPAIVGFREHIFSGLGLLGDLAASSELCFGTLVQRTMAEPLWCRYHYGHPDMLDKLALLAQGGVSKATKDLNLSEDVFAGMDATLRGNTIVHREYFQVGKGRDLGAITILQFFSKLSQGTAQMTTSRQALRLGLRLGFGRLLGFYYAHVGYYLGQLHFYHASYLQLALMLGGALCDGTGVLPGASEPAASLFNRLYGVLSVLFFAFSILPLFLALLVEEGPRSATLKPLWQIARLSPLFFVLQSRAIAHYFSMEFAVGGASYIPTGRGLAISHQRFSELYASFAASSIYPGAELLLMLVLPPLVMPSLELNLWSVVLAGLTPCALLLGPALFNPRAFVLSEVMHDFVDWARWLGRRTPQRDSFAAAHSWSDFHALKQEDKARVRSHALFLPSKEMLIGLPMLLLSYEAMQSHGWGWYHLTLLALPAAPFAVTFVVLLVGAAAARLPCVRCSRHDNGQASLERLLSCSIWIQALLSLCCAVIFAAEVWLVINYLELRLSRAEWVTLLVTRYFSWRVACNILLYICQAASARAFAIGQKRSREWSCVGNFVAMTLACTVAAVALLGDAVLGLLLQLPFLLSALLDATLGLLLQLPTLLIALCGCGSHAWQGGLVTRAHHFMLLGLTEKKLRKLNDMPNDPALLTRKGERRHGDSARDFTTTTLTVYLSGCGRGVGIGLTPRNVITTLVPGGAAALSGQLRLGDRVVGVDGQTLETPEGNHTLGEVLRPADLHIFEVQRQDEEFSPQQTIVYLSGCSHGLGLGLNPRNVITTFVPGGAAALSGQLRLGDRVVGVDGQPLESAEGNILLRDVLRPADLHFFEVVRHDKDQTHPAHERALPSVGSYAESSHRNITPSDDSARRLFQTTRQPIQEDSIEAGISTSFSDAPSGSITYSI